MRIWNERDSHRLPAEYMSITSLKGLAVKVECAHIPQPSNSTRGHTLEQWFSNFSVCLNHLKDWLKHRLLDLTPGVGPTSSKFPDDADAAGPGTTELLV